MAVEALADPISSIITLTKWLQAIGAVLIIWIIFQTLNWWINRKRLKELYKIKDDMIRIEKKIDNLAKK